MSVIIFMKVMNHLKLVLCAALAVISLLRNNLSAVNN